MSDSDSIPDWKRRVARTTFHEDPPIELPILEITAATAYRLSGGERLWIPRLSSSLFWIIGGLCLYLVATRFVAQWGAFLVTAIYLFLPYATVASTSFQPDPLMIMLLLAAVLATILHHEQPTRKRLVGALILCGTAVLVKPGIAAFFLFPLFAALAIVREGLRGALTRPYFYAFPALSSLPAAALYVYSSITDQFLSGHVEAKINPRLLQESFYWQGWLDNVSDVLRPPFVGEQLSLVVLATAACGILLARTRTQRAILLALWCGYAVFGLVFTNHISSHNYYSLPLIPIVALSLGLVADVLGEYLRGPLRRRSVRVSVVTLVAVMVALGLREKGADLHLPRPDEQYQPRVEIYEHIGELVDHTTRALVLERIGGLWHHGWVAGRYWPNRGDLSWEQTQEGLRPMSADQRFVTRDERYYPAVGAMRPRPSVFIVSDAIELVLQPDLSVLLSDFPVLAETPDYVIFDLTRTMSMRAKPRGEEATIRSSTGFFYRFPPTWSAVERGMTRDEVAHVLGRPDRAEIRRDLRKPFETWFYGRNDKYAIVFIDGGMFVKAQSR